MPSNSRAWEVWGSSRRGGAINAAQFNLVSCQRWSNYTSVGSGDVGARWGCGGVGQLGHVPLALYHVLVSTSPDHHVVRVTVSCGLADGQVRGGQHGGMSPQLSHLLVDRGTNPALAWGGKVGRGV